ncbi:hypothetical protein I5Q34_20980 [Streptomyces sp. AV19]|uniref:hypothetical protein n=1 Tax=Streptomyces sp. AV19 TaxID=2793068 RepID=UPI0018FE48D1|nr:hypothetical protein [Streptomyces sp. AV19]MBH1936721.1 hypothetical protein [Streptomyces sp. AV19]MDG4532779.1 hypothetical protein [Streptomyces sp. AV19]
MTTEAERVRMAVPPRPAHPPATAPAPPPRRTAAVAVCAVLGLGLLGGAAVGGRLTAPPSRTAAELTYERGGTLWSDVPVDELFPRSVHSPDGGPGGASRDWRRLGVAPDGDCAPALDPALARALEPAGCRRLLRATYADVTSTNVTTVGLLVTGTDRAGMRALRSRVTAGRLDERADMLPRPYAPPGTAAARFGDAQRATWWLAVRTDLPLVVWSVTGFADGRTGTALQPAARAVVPGAASDVAQAGLGHEARALAGRIESAFRAAAARR